MADVGFLATGFKPETVQYLMENMEKIWPDFTMEKGEDLINFLTKNGVTCEADMNTIDEGELAAVVGLSTAKNILLLFSMIDPQNQAHEHGEKMESPSSTTGQLDASPKDGVGPLYQKTDQTAHHEQSVKDLKKEKALVSSDAAGNAITSLAGAVEIAMNTMSTTIAKQIDIQSRMLDAFSTTVNRQSDVMSQMSRDMANIQNNQADFMARTMDRMENSEKRNHDNIMDLTRKVNSALLEREKNRPALSANCVVM